MYKKLSYLLIIAVVALSSCDKTINDVYDELDGVKNPLNKTVDYTLTSADYAAISTAALADATTDAETLLARAVASTLALNNFATADKYVPARLSIAFPALNKNSIVNVSYAYREDYLAMLAGAPTYTLTAADYEAVWGDGSTTNFLTPSNTPAAKLPAILSAAYPAAVAGDVVLASFRYADDEPGPVPTRLSEDFEGYTPATSSPYTQWNQNGWTQTTTQGGGAKNWQIRVYSGNNYAQISANGGATEVTEVYMVSPLVDLTQTTNNEFSFDVCIGYWNYNGLTILITEDATALTAPASAAWTDVTSNFTIPSAPASGYGTFGPAGVMNLDASYAGKKIYIAFRYNGETGANTRTTTYQLDKILVKGTAPAGSKDVTPRVENLIYTYSGTAWTVYPNAVILNPADYTAMGIATISATDAPKYLPNYLRTKFPYALENSKIAVVYKSGTTTNAADEYMLSAGLWQPSLKAALKTEQFVHNGTRWLFDPTINYTMVSADYQIMCTYVLGHPVLGVYFRNGTSGTPYTNEEWYYGFSAYYSNINFRLSGSATSSRDVPSSLANDTELHSLTTNEAKSELLWKRLTEEGMVTYLQLKYPDSPAEAQGVQLYYNITATVYYPDGVTNTTLRYVLKYKVLTAGTPGTPPTFEYLEKEQL